MWTEKYRPYKLENIKNQDILIKILSNKDLQQNLPHLILYGEPGIGKTTTALALCKTIFTSEIIKSRVLELNASDSRGIEVIRTIIKTFAKNTINKVPNCPNYKVIILDEFDAMTYDAQYALRRIIEIYSNTTRFILICNYLEKIIDPIQSRCALYKFKKFTTTNIKTVIDKIALKENINLTDNKIKYITYKSNGDMRKAINLLYYIRNTDEELIDNNFINKIKNDELLDVVQEIICENYEITEILDQIKEYLIDNNSNNNSNNKESILKLVNGEQNINLKNSVFIELINICNSIKS